MLQRRLLVWLYEEERRILDQGTERQRKVLNRLGVPFNQKRFLDVGSVDAAKRASISRALRSLEASPRRLVVLLGSGTARTHTTHVRLTDAARAEAARLAANSMRTAREVEAQRAREAHFESVTARLAVQADAVLLDILRLRMVRLRGRRPNETHEEFEAWWQSTQVDLDNARQRLERLRAVSPTAVDASTANLYFAVTLVPSEIRDQLGADLEFTVSESELKYSDAVRKEVSEADEETLEDLRLL